MADTELYVTKVRTNSGDKLIDYNALANLPQSDTTLTKSGKFADAKVVGDTLKNKADKTSIPTKLSEFENDPGFLTEVPTEYITEDELAEQGYLTETQLNAKGYVTETALAEQKYVTESVLSNKGYITETQLSGGGNLVATDDKPGVVKPGEGLTVIDGTLNVDKHPLEDLSNIHICQDGMPDLGTIINGHWYLVKAEE